MKSALKLLILVFSFLALLSACGGGTGASPNSSPVPTWMSGSNTKNQAGTYGTQGTAASSNVPGARSGAVSWSDSSGNLWLFGGYGRDSAGNLGYLNDLWKYDPTALEWTWVSGSNIMNQMGVYGNQGAAAPSNVPGARQHAVSWLDSSGRLWLFGGTGLDSAATIGRLNDLWKYDPTTLEWTWVSGSDSFGQKGTYGTQGVAAPSNVPGARSGAVSWLDSSGRLWLFGGLGYDSAAYNGDLNDLWDYDPTTLEWTWVSGSSAIDQSGTYGTKGTAASSNVPGARDAAISWIDSSGKLWLFGGSGNDSAGTVGRLNDLWKYDPTALEWTWVSGSNTINQAGTYGTQGTAASSNVPGARDTAVSWIDSSGKLWLFGGYGNDSAGSIGYLNDLWKYDPAALEWTWVSGGDTVNKTGTYGTKGAAASSNIPGARASAIPWLDSGGKLWLFGGEGIDSAGAYGYLNDLWQFTR